jgi:hypothetical protein
LALRLFDVTMYVQRHGILRTGQTLRILVLESRFSADMASRLGWMFELFCQLLNHYDENRVNS